MPTTPPEKPAVFRAASIEDAFAKIIAMLSEPRSCEIVRGALRNGLDYEYTIKVKQRDFRKGYSVEFNRRTAAKTQIAFFAGLS